MKRLLFLILIFVLIASPSLSQELARMNVGVMGGGAAAPACATADTTIPHDTLLEGFNDADGEENVWNDVTGTPSFGADTTALSSGKPTGACNKGVYFNIADTNLYSTWDNGGDITMTGGLDYYFYMYITAAPGNTLSIRLNALAHTTSFTAEKLVYFTFLGTAGNPTLTANGVTNSSATALTLNAWHKIKVHLDADAAAGGSYFEVDDGGTTNTFQRGNYAARYIHLGAGSGMAVGDTAQIYFDLVTLDVP